MLLVFAPAAARAQGPAITASRWLTSPAATDLRLGGGGVRLGPIAVAPFGAVAWSGGPSDRHLLIGGGADIVIRLTAEARPYLVGGVSGGFLDLKSGGPTALWRAWSGGAGVELGRAAGIGVGIEIRYQSLSRPATEGATIGLRLGRPLGRSSMRQPRSARGTAPPPAAPVRPAEPTPAAPGIPPSLSTAGRGSRSEVRSALKAALDVMGTPYRWGGTTDNGFDCSGLIQYAYATAGLALPRRSGDQARAGRSVGTTLDDLEPGDILAFSGGRNGVVTHVGLYLGNGRFIHSARDGVVVSSLSADDITGRWWLDRWVDSRRLID